MNRGTLNGADDCRGERISYANLLSIEENAQPVTFCEAIIDEAGKSLLDVGSSVVYENLV
jgi:hypothetical protein